MKEGTGGDPFADNDTDSDPNETDTTTEPATAEPEAGDSETPTTDTQSSTTDESAAVLPYIYRRDTVKEDRDQVPFFLRDHVRRAEADFIDQLEDRLDANVYKADAREAALEIAFETQVAEVAARLREWGYDH